MVGYALQPPTSPSIFELCGLAEKMNSIEGDIRDLEQVANETAFIKFIKDIEREQTHNKSAILKLLNYNEIMKPGAVSLLGILKDNIKDLQKIADDINNYARYNDPIKNIDDDILSIKEKYIIAITRYNETGRDWCGVGCYTVKNGEIVARYDWMGQPNTCHAGEVVRCAVNLAGF